MSEHASSTAGTEGPVTLETGLESFQSSSEFHGPVEDLDGHDCNDHFAQIYETPTEKFEAAVPFVRHGLDRGERVAYVVDQSTETEVRTALRDAGIDVEAALDSGALAFYTVDETYLRDGSFDPDEMIQFYADATAAATEDFEALRLVAEMSWIEADDTTVEELMEYESKINDLFDREDVLAICQYDRNLFAPGVIQNVVRTHPHLIYDGAVCHNFYYTPPEELFGDDDPARENERMLRTLHDRATAKAELQQRDRFLRDLYAVASNQTKSFEAKLDALFELGCEQFDLDFGFLNRVDLEADRLEVEYASDDHDYYEVGGELPLSETYCQAAVDIREAADVSNPAEAGFDDLLVYEDFGVEGYLGTYIPVEGGTDRTLAFVPDGSHEESFSERDKAYLELMGQWVGYELNRRQREQFLRRCHELTSDPALDFEEKLHQLLDLARERMDLDAAGLTHLPEWDGRFLTEYAIGYGDGDEVVDASDGVWTDPSEGCYCRQAITADEPVGKADVRGTDWEDDEIYQEHGLTCYFGTKVTNRSTPYGTLWVGSTEPRDRGLSETERTFLELMGQWVSYELERREYSEAQRELYEITSDPDRSFDEKLDALFELGREQFGLELGGLARIDPSTDYFEVEEISGEHEYLAPGEQYPLSETYCRLAAADGETATVSDPVSAGFEDDLCYDEFGVEAYLGTHLDVDGDVDRTFFFVSNEPREEPITDAEQTFHHLMGQWVQYELERRQRERELRERTEHLRALVETTPECIKTVAEDGTLLQMNAAGLDMVEADSASDVTGECVYDLIAPEHRERFREFNERICSGERETLEFDVVGLEGTRRHMESHAAPLERPDGTTVQVALTRDVTERKERKRELERIERQFEATFNNPSSFMGLLDPDGTVRRINETALEFAGVDESDVRGQKFWETPWFAHSEEVREELRTGIERAADGEYVRAEIPHRSPDGDTVIMDAMLEPVYDEDGEVTTIVPSGYDVTERKQHEERLERKTDRLESFASLLAHELRNPVTIGQIYSQQLPAEADSEAVEYITEAFDRIENMIDVMLVLTRGCEAIDEATSVDLAGTAREAWDAVDAPEAALDVELERTIQADETYVRHLFQNLLENAVDHGGADVTITIGELDDGFYVADDGTGIPEEERDAIFDEGYTTAADNGGTGLGLAFVQKLAEVYNWDYAVTDSTDGGARFEFTNVTQDVRD